MAFTVPITSVTAAPVAGALALTGGPRSVIVVDVGYFRAAGADANPTSVTDSVGNTYLAVGATISFNVAPTQYKARRYACIGGTGGATVVITVNFTNANDLVTTWVREGLSSVGTTIAQDQAPAGLNDQHTDATPYVSNSATTTSANELLLACAVTASNSPGPEVYTHGNSFIEDSPQGNTVLITGVSSHRIVAATGTYATSLGAVSGGGTDEAITFLTTFKEVSANQSNSLFFGAFP